MSDTILFLVLERLGLWLGAAGPHDPSSQPQQQLQQQRQLVNVNLPDTPAANKLLFCTTNNCSAVATTNTNTPLYFAAAITSCEPTVAHATAAPCAGRTNATAAPAFIDVQLDMILCGLLPCLILATMLILVYLEKRLFHEERRRHAKLDKSRQRQKEQQQSPTRDAHGQAWAGRRVGDFVLGSRCIARGLHGHVREAQHTVTGARAAVKILDKSLHQPPPNREAQLLAQVQGHRGIVRLLDVVETDPHVFLVEEYLAGGELFDLVCTRGRLSEDEARGYWQQIVAAVAFLHSAGVVHRDIKLENVMLARPGGRRVKLIDLGLSCAVPRRGTVGGSGSSGGSGLLKSFCGSLEYAAPEILRHEPYDGRACDVWSLGCLLYTMVMGHRPFADRVAAEAVHYQVPLDIIDASPEFRDLVSQIFVREAGRRLTIHGVMAHPWTGLV